VTGRAFAMKVLLQFKNQNAEAHILVIVCQLWYVQPHHLPNVLEEKEFWRNVRARLSMENLKKQTLNYDNDGNLFKRGLNTFLYR